MNIIEKLESFQQQLIGIGQTAAACDLQNIIEEYKATEQEPFGYFKAEPFGWTDCAETEEGAKALYESPQLSDETVKDAERYRWLRNKANFARKSDPIVCKYPLGEQKLIDGDELDVSIDEAMKADNKDVVEIIANGVPYSERPQNLVFGKPEK